MALSPGTRLGAYEILSLLGKGGMGEVYRAKDTRLNRIVAIKVLPDALAADPQFRERFDREARAISQLTHPHICVLYDVGHQNGTDYLVLEYLDGETLARRLERGPLKLADALKIAADIADALDKAHRAGVVHRDLKPANVMLTEGGPKVLDFGLAKFLHPSVAGSGLSHALTEEVSQLTSRGEVVGTLQYLSPEQLAEGKVDSRSDIWGLGCILYEMLTGMKAFIGTNRPTVIAAILNSDPHPIGKSATAQSIEWVLSRCLAKDPDERWQTARDLRAELRRAATDVVESVRVSGDAPFRLSKWNAWIVLTVMAIATTIVLTLRSRSDQKVEVPVQFSIDPPQGLEFPGSPGSPMPAVSADGRRVAFVVTRRGRTLLALRNIDSSQVQTLTGTDDGTLPFWSPDSRLIGFFAQGKIKKIDLAGGAAQTICDAPSSAMGASWSNDDVILFAPSPATGLMRVAASGGNPLAVTTPDSKAGEISHMWPVFLPDGKHFLFIARPASDVYVGSLNSSAHIRLTSTDSKAFYASPGYLLFHKGGQLLAQSFDTKQLTLSGEPQRLADNVFVISGRASFAVSNDVLVYRPGVSNLLSRLTWFDRTGRNLGLVAGTDTNSYQGIALSRDGKRVAAHVHEPDGGDLWVADIERGLMSRLTFSPKLHYASPTWSDDGSLIAFESQLGIQQRRADGVSGDQLLVKADIPFSLPTSWSADRRFLLFEALDSRTNWDVLALPLSGDHRPFDFLRTNANEMQARFSPDGRFVAYQSDESGRFEIYVQSFPTSGSKWQISLNGGGHPRWRADGRELYFIGPDETLMGVDMSVEGGRLSSGTPRPLFDIRPAMSSGLGTAYIQYDVTPGAERFIIATSIAPQQRPLTVLINWTAALKK